MQNIKKKWGGSCWRMATNVWYSKVTNQDNIHTSTGGRFTIVPLSQDADLLPTITQVYTYITALTLSCRSGLAAVPNRSSTTLWWPLMVAHSRAAQPSWMCERNHMRWFCNSWQQAQYTLVIGYSRHGNILHTSLTTCSSGIKHHWPCAGYVFCSSMVLNQYCVVVSVQWTQPVIHYKLQISTGCVLDTFSVFPMVLNVMW